MKCTPSGPQPADILIVGEAPGLEEERQGIPFVGASGNELTRMLNEAGILRTECRITNVCPFRPPRNDITAFFVKRTQATWIPGPRITEGLEELRAEIQATRPKVILALGATALWALTGEKDITKWRGSYLELREDWRGELAPVVIPTYHPAAILRQWSWRATAVQDFRRAKRAVERRPERPSYTFHTRPTLSTVLECLGSLMPSGEPVRLAVDIETRRRQITCIGLAWNKREALCIPLTSLHSPDGSYWTLEEELAIIKALRRLLTHPLTRIIGQNFSYDAQYIARQWGFLALPAFDTMIAHATCWPGTPKSLDYLSSLYCEWHQYWKDDRKDWDTKMDEEILWAYNARDCVVTYEVAEALEGVLDSLNLRPQFDFLMSLVRPVLMMMLRGVRVDMKARGRAAWELAQAMAEREAFFEKLIGVRSLAKTKGASPWWTSTKQLRQLFYEIFAIPPVRDRKTGRPTVKDEALAKIPKREPLLLPLCRALQEYRSSGTVLRNFVQAPLDWDHRFRSSLNIVGTETFRFASSADAFGFGANAQNITKGGRTGRFTIPNLRKLLVPDPGYIIADCDLDRADLQIVVWEAGDEELKQMLREGVDIHTENSKVLGVTRDFAKRFCHGANYGSGARTMAAHLGITVHQAERFLKRWFSAHPKIKEWHRRVERSLMETRSVRNPFGFRRYYFDRIEGLLPEALAWVPQCVTGDCAALTPEGWVRLDEIAVDAPIAVWREGEVTFEVPRMWHKSTTTHLQYCPRLGYACTDNHKLPYYNAGRESLHVATADALPKGARVPMTGVLQGDEEVPPALVQLIVATQADGSLDHYRNALIFELHKERKIQRLTEILRALGADFSISPVRGGAAAYFYIHLDTLPHHPIFETKQFGPWLLRWNTEARELFLEELEHWDGWRSPRGELWYSSKVKENCEWVSTIAALTNYRARWLSPDTRGADPIWRVTIAPRIGKRTIPQFRPITTPPTEVFCPEVSTGFWLVRAPNGTISVTGNSSVAIVTNMGLRNLYENVPEVQLLLQVHDSLVFQYPAHLDPHIRPRIREQLLIRVPYEDPLTIPVGLKISTSSWGEVEDAEWEVAA